MKREILACLALCCATLAHAGWFDSFETLKTNTPAEAEDSVLYMTGNGFTPDERYFVFGRRIDKAAREKNGQIKGRFQMYRRDMTTGQETRLTPESTRITYLGGVVGGNSLFFGTLGKDSGLYEVDVPSASEPKMIWKFPKTVRGKEWYKVYPLSTTTDGNTVLVTLQDEIPVELGTKLNAWHEAFMQSGAHAYLYLGKRTASGWDFKLLYEQEDITKGWVGHAQLNPQTGKDVYYELDGDCRKLEQRGWLLDIETGKHSKVYPEENAAVCTTHGNYIKDGLIEIQEYKGSGPVRSDAILFHTKTGQFERYDVGPHMHLQAFEKDGTYFIFGDGWIKDQTVKRYVFKNGKQIDSTTVANHGSHTAWEEYHQHARLSPSGKWMVFSSSNGMGDDSVIIVKDPLKLD